MRVIQLTPGAGAMFCGNCFRDNSFVAEMRRLGHEVLLVPLYLPLRLEEQDQSAGTPIFFNGINVYLEQKSALFRNAPDWMHHLLASPSLLKLAAGFAAKTNPATLGELVLSMIRGELGNQAREIDQLCAWLKKQPPFDVVCLSNIMLAGVVRRIKSELNIPVVTTLQGEDTFLDGVSSDYRTLIWETLADRSRDIDLFIGPSAFFADQMQKRLRLPPEKVTVVYDGIHLDGFEPTTNLGTQEPVLGFFARMCREKGLHLLVDAFILFRARHRASRLRLHVGGGCGPSDEPFVDEQKSKLSAAGLLKDVRFSPNVDRIEKQRFFSELTLFSVPAIYGEAFGLYLAEAWASGVPVIQPAEAAFPELISLSKGGLLFESRSPQKLADAIEYLLSHPEEMKSLSECGRRAAKEHFSAQTMTRGMLKALERVIRVN